MINQFKNFICTFTCPTSLYMLQIPQQQHLSSKNNLSKAPLSDHLQLHDVHSQISDKAVKPTISDDHSQPTQSLHHSQVHTLPLQPLLVSCVPPPPPLPPQGNNIPPPPLLPHSVMPTNQQPVISSPWKTKTTFNKAVVIPNVPMKPLFWTRILLSPDNQEKTIWSNLNECPVDYDELVDQFRKSDMSKDSLNRISSRRNSIKQVAKLLDHRQSQQIGILLSTLRLTATEVEDALRDVDTGILTYSHLLLLSEMKIDSGELQKIKDHLSHDVHIPLDKPEQFLHDLSLIPFCTERVSCLLFTFKFSEATDSLSVKLYGIKSIINDFLRHSSIKEILGVILTVGNYLNGGNKVRGQADGFNLDILCKLVDLKSKDGQSNLLTFVVRDYLRLYHNDHDCDNLCYPLPNHTDIAQASMVDFDEIGSELDKLQQCLCDYELTMEKVIQSMQQGGAEKFTQKMVKFFERGKQDIMDVLDDLQITKLKFTEMLSYFVVKPKLGHTVVSPQQFFELWVTFCKNFKDVWLKEQQQKSKMSRGILKQRKLVQTREIRPGGLKDKLKKKGLI